jgi:hypothetical protein
MKVAVFGVERITRLLLRCKAYERYYMEQDPKPFNYTSLADILTRLYSAVLVFIASSKRVFDRNRIRMFTEPRSHDFANIMSKIELATDCWPRKGYNQDLIPLKNMSHLWSGKCVLQIWKVGGQELQIWKVGGQKLESIGGIDRPLTWFGSVP